MAKLNETAVRKQAGRRKKKEECMAEKKVEGQKPFEYNVNDNKNTKVILIINL